MRAVLAPPRAGARSCFARLARVGGTLTLAALLLVSAHPGVAIAQLGSWQTVAPSGPPRQEVAYVASGGWIYLAGGHNTHHERYNPATNTWEELAPLPESLDHVQAVALGGKVYYIGGLQPHPDPAKWPGASSGDVHIYNPATNTFSRGKPMPSGRERGAGGVGVYGGKIYYVGGLHDGAAVNWLDVYDPVADAWSVLPSMPTERDHFQAAVVGRELFAIGGRDTTISNTTAANESYDFSTGQWRSDRQGLPTKRGGFASAVVGCEILIIGGEGGGPSDGAFATVEGYDPVNDTWRAMAPMAVARHGIQAATYAGKVYVAAGGTKQGGGGATDVQEVFTPPPPRTHCSSVPAPPCCPTGQSPAGDRIAPVLDQVRLSRTWLRGRSATRVSFRLSERGTVRLTVARRAKRRHRLVRVPGTLIRHVAAGRNRIVFRGRIGGRRLPSGRYRLTLQAADLSGNVSRRRHVGLRIIRGRHRPAAGRAAPATGDGISPCGRLWPRRSGPRP